MTDRKLTRRSIARIAVAAPGLALVGISAAGRAQPKYPDPVKIGAVLNLSGPTAAQGNDFRAGLEFAAQQWNAKGGIGGSKIEFLFEDHAAQPAKAVTAAQKLIQVDGVKVLVNVYSSPVLAVAPIAAKEKVLQISAGATSPRLVNISKYFMTSVANAALEVEVMLAFIKKKLDVKKLAIIYSNDDFGLGIRDVAKTGWSASGGTIVAEEGIEPAKADLGAVATKVAGAKPDAVYVALSGAALGSTVKNLREAGYDGAIVSHQGYETPDLFSVAGSAIGKSYWTSAAQLASAEGKAADEAFAAEFKKAFNRPPETYVRTHYDMAMSLFQAMDNLRKAGKEWSAENIRGALLALGTINGVLGPFAYREDGTALRELDIRSMMADGKPGVLMTADQIQKEGIFSFKTDK
jgi:branched-chain amino acid transport system substrate-binding protein